MGKQNEVTFLARKDGCPMEGKLTPKARLVQEALRRFGLPCEVEQLPDSTRTAREAAQAVGCTVDEIAKSILFRGSQTGKPYLVIARGTRRIDERKLASLVEEPVTKADAEFVRRQTGYAIGGVPPFAHTNKIETFIDEGLLPYENLWVAAGTPHAVFKIAPRELLRITGGRVCQVT